MSIKVNGDIMIYKVTHDVMFLYHFNEQMTSHIQLHYFRLIYLSSLVFFEKVKKVYNIFLMSVVIPIMFGYFKYRLIFCIKVH